MSLLEKYKKCGQEPNFPPPVAADDLSTTRSQINTEILQPDPVTVCTVREIIFLPVKNTEKCKKMFSQSLLIFSGQKKVKETLIKKKMKKMGDPQKKRWADDGRRWAMCPSNKKKRRWASQKKKRWGNAHFFKSIFGAHLSPIPSCRAKNYL